jgi:hypothetical protein
LFQYVEIEIGDRKMSVKEMYAEEIQNLINDIVILSKLNNRANIKQTNEETTISTMYGFEINLNEKHSICFWFNSDKPSYSKDKREVKMVSSFYCDYSMGMEKHFLFKNDFTIQKKTNNNSMETVSFATMIKILDKIKEIIIQL